MSSAWGVSWLDWGDSWNIGVVPEPEPTPTPTPIPVPSTGGGNAIGGYWHGPRVHSPGWYGPEQWWDTEPRVRRHTGKVRLRACRPEGESRFLPVVLVRRHAGMASLGGLAAWAEYQRYTTFRHTGGALVQGPGTAALLARHKGTIGAATLPTYSPTGEYHRARVHESMPARKRAVRLRQRQEDRILLGVLDEAELLEALS